jgi:hypothetical protein
MASWAGVGSALQAYEEAAATARAPSVCERMAGY